MKMQNKTLMKWLILVGALSSLKGLHAQTFIGSGWTQTGPNVSFGVDTGYGTFVSTAPFNSSVTFTGAESTTNPQLLWVPALAALRVGSFYSAPSTTTMGQYSVAFGSGNTASGTGSAAFGTGNSASGSSATAFGGYSNASGMFSIAAGFVNNATQISSMAFGVGTSASGYTSTTFGSSTTASGSNSTAMGQSTTAASEDAFSVGAYNTGTSEAGAPTPNATTWVATDPLFEIGNGTGTGSNASDAVAVYKDGTMKVEGPITVTKVGGDIPMYTGN